MVLTGNWLPVVSITQQQSRLDGTLWTWTQDDGALGDNTTANKSSPVQTIAGSTNWKQVAGGGIIQQQLKLMVLYGYGD